MVQLIFCKEVWVSQQQRDLINSGVPQHKQRQQKRLVLRSPHCKVLDSPPERQYSKLLLLPKLKAFAREKTGSIAVYGALFMTTAAGLAGMGMDMSIWYAMKRDVQGMADAAAVSAAYAVLQNQTDIGVNHGGFGYGIYFDLDFLLLRFQFKFLRYILKQFCQ